MSAPPKQSATYLPVVALVPHHANIRDDLGDLSDLAQSIRAQGIVQPLVVTEHPKKLGKYLILAGHRRHAAATRAGLAQVPCVIRHHVDDHADQLELMLVENLQRRDLDTVEKAQAIGALLNRGLTQAEVARRIGVSGPTINYYAALLELSEEELEQIRLGGVNVTDAINGVREHRKATRELDGAPVRGRPIHVEPRHFTKQHPLASIAYERCDHTRRQKVGSIACGQCWEQAIRDDALGLLEETGGPIVGTINSYAANLPVDEIAVQRALDGDRTVRLNASELRAAITSLHARGASDRQIARTLGRADRVIHRIRNGDLGLPANDNVHVTQETFA